MLIRSEVFSQGLGHIGILLDKFWLNIYSHGSNPGYPPLNIRFNPTTTIGSNMRGAPTYPKMVPLGLLTHSHMCPFEVCFFGSVGRIWVAPKLFLNLFGVATPKRLNLYFQDCPSPLGKGVETRKKISVQPCFVEDKVISCALSSFAFSW